MRSFSDNVGMIIETLGLRLMLVGFGLPIILRLFADNVQSGS